MIRTAVLFVVLAASTAQVQPKVTGRETIVGLPCEGCEGVFPGIPSTLSSVARIAPVSEPGEPMVITGRVTNAAGAPVPGIVVYGYQTDAKGIYPPATQFTGAARRHGTLRGWAITDAKGEYRFDTIRPAPYPNAKIPAHVHLHVIEPGRNTYYIDELLFDDDPLLTAEERAKMRLGRGSDGTVGHPVRAAGLAWHVKRDIVLGKDVPGYK